MSVSFRIIYTKWYPVVFYAERNDPDSMQLGRTIVQFIGDLAAYARFATKRGESVRSGTPVNVVAIANLTQNIGWTFITRYF